MLRYIISEDFFILLVRRAILDELRQNNRTSRVNDQTDYRCPEEGFKTPPLNHRKRGPVTPLPSSSSSSSFLDPSSTPIAQESKQTNGLNAMKIREERFSSTHAATSTPPIEADTATPSVKATGENTLIKIECVCVCASVRPLYV